MADERLSNVASVALLVAVVVAGVGVAAESPSLVGTPPWLATPMGWESVLAPRDEPGGRFVMEGRLIGPDGRAGTPGVEMYAYHADRDGLYAREARHHVRLAGVLTTDARGRYRIVSALPGSYGGAPHVHLEAWGHTTFAFDSGP